MSCCLCRDTGLRFEPPRFTPGVIPIVVPCECRDLKPGGSEAGGGLIPGGLDNDIAAELFPRGLFSLGRKAPLRFHSSTERPPRERKGAMEEEKESAEAIAELCDRFVSVMTRTRKALELELSERIAGFEKTTGFRVASIEIVRIGPDLGAIPERQAIKIVLGDFGRGGR